MVKIEYAHQNKSRGKRNMTHLFDVGHKVQQLSALVLTVENSEEMFLVLQLNRNLAPAYSFVCVRYRTPFD